MKKLIIYFVILSTIISCKKNSELSKIYNCNTTTLENSKYISDYNKNFKLYTPTNWKTSFYYDFNSSEIHTADTTKQLTNTFILNTSFNFGKLKFNQTFYKKSDSVLVASNLIKLKSGNIIFQKKPAYWLEAKGFKNGFEYHVFNLIVQNSETSYFNASSEVYGTKNIEQRICESISILDKIQFLD